MPRRRTVGAFLFAAAMFPAMPSSLPGADLRSPELSETSLALASNDDYVRHGAVTNFETCLHVANDHRATMLWEGKDPEIGKAKRAGAHDLTEALEALDKQTKLQLGYGTLYACAQIAAAWSAEGNRFGIDSRLSSDPNWQDGRRQHGTVVIDLKIGEATYRYLEPDEFDGENYNFERPPITKEASGPLRATIEAIPLVRILTSPLLLPPRDFGGVVIRNAEIDGALLFYSVHLGIPLSFANVRFLGSNYPKHVFGDDEVPVPDAAISVINSHFTDQVQISASEVCGHVRLIDSQFADSLSFRGVNQYGNRCRPEATDDKPLVRVNSSTFLQGLVITQSAFGGLHISGSDIQSFASSRSHFEKRLWIRESDIGALQINCSILANNVDLSYNHVKKDLFIYGSQYSKKYPPDNVSCSQWWAERQPAGQRKSIRIASNRIDGGLGLMDLNGGTVEPIIDLASNRVGNGSEIRLPAFNRLLGLWNGHLKLEGSTYQGRVEIGVDQPASVNSLRASTDAYCPSLHTHQPPAAVVDLRAAQIRTLVWDLPFICSYRWSGYGLKYDLWMAGSTAKASADPTETDSHQRLLRRWRQSLSTYEPASLNAMSQYLVEKGSYVDSRDVLLEAKRLNYAPNCRPDAGLIECAHRVLSPPELPDTLPFATSALATEANVTTKLAEEASNKAADHPPLTTRIGKAIMVLLLWPGGYGAKPEQALMWLALAAFVFCLIYYGYSLVLNRLLLGVPGLSSVIRRPSAEGQADELKPDSIKRLDDILKQWPDRSSWSYWDKDRRLNTIRKVLLPKLEAAIDDMPMPALGDLKVVRAKLERFGSTETLGFSLFDGGKRPTRFTHWRYSIDTMVPFIDLHAYSNYYPESGWMRFASVLQHVIGWWLMTVFIASAAIL